jgi:hypothetical protein
MLFGDGTLQAWCFQALQQIVCEQCGSTCSENTNETGAGKDKGNTKAGQYHP